MKVIQHIINMYPMRIDIKYVYLKTITKNENLNINTLNYFSVIQMLSIHWNWIYLTNKCNDIIKYKISKHSYT